MKLLITGICGFVGSTLAENWLSAEPGLTVYGLDNFSRPGSEQNRQRLQKLGVRLCYGDIRSAADFEPLPAVDWVIDAAANPSVLAGVDGRTSSRQLIEHNLLGTVNLLEYCKRTGAGFILVSTSRVYSIRPLAALAMDVYKDAFRPVAGQAFPPGVSAAGVSEHFSTTPPLSLYGSSKLASETLALEYGETFDFPVWINRCGVLGGAGQFGKADQGVFAYWINSWLRRRPLTYLGFDGTGRQVRDCLHPRDLTALLRKQIAAGTESSDRIYNLGGGPANAMSLAELSAWCRERFGPHQVDRVGETRRFDVPWLIMDASLAMTRWNWQPETRLPAILDEIAWHAEQHPEWLDLSGGS